MRGPSRTISSLTISTSLISTSASFLFVPFQAKVFSVFLQKKKKKFHFFKMDPRVRVHSRVNGYFRKWIGSDFVENYFFFFLKKTKGGHLQQ